jgi:hypothetical protein
MEAITAIHELCDAREKNETVGIADALEYELLPNLENWRQWLVKKTDPGVAFRELERKTTPKSG